MIGFGRSLNNNTSKSTNNNNPCVFIIDPYEITKDVKDVKDHITIIVAFPEATTDSVRITLSNYFVILNGIEEAENTGSKFLEDSRKYFPPKPHNGVFEYLFDKSNVFPKKIVVKGASSSTLEKLRKIVSSNSASGWKYSDNTYKEKIVKSGYGLSNTTFTNFYFDDSITYEFITNLAFEFQNHCNSSAYVVCVNDTGVKIPYSNCISCFPNLMNVNQKFSLMIKGSHDTAGDEPGRNLKIAYEDLYRTTKKYKNQEFVVVKPKLLEPFNGKFTFEIVCKNNEDALNLFNTMKTIKEVELDNNTKPIKELNSWVHDGEYIVIYNYKKKSAKELGLPENVDLATLNQKRIDNFNSLIFSNGKEQLLPEFFKRTVIRSYSPEDGRAYFKFDFPVMAKIFCFIHNYRAKVSSALVLRENLMETKNFNLPEPLPFSLPADTYVYEPDTQVNEVPPNEIRSHNSKFVDSDITKSEAFINAVNKEVALLREKDKAAGDLPITKNIDEKLLDETIILLRQNNTKFLEMQEAMIELLKQPPIYCTKLENYFQTNASNSYLYLHKKPRIITIHEFLLNFKDSHKFIQMIMDGPVYMLMTSNPFSIQTCRVFCGIVIYLLAASSDTTKDKADVFPLFLENAELIHIVLDGIHTKKEPTTIFFCLLAQFGTKIEHMQNLGFLVLVNFIILHIYYILT
jgi:hypothetical protein